MKVELSEQAKLIMREIIDYTLEIWGRNQAKTYKKSFDKKFNTIATFPYHGRFIQQ
jgi:plasmid stabilization system protein ParE